MRSFFRRRYLVSRSQAHLVLYQVVYYAVFVLVLSAGLWGPLVLEMSEDGEAADRAAVARVLLYMHGRIWPLAALLLVVSAVHSIFITHRVVGPLVRFRRVFRSIAAGRLAQQVVLRKKDYLDDEAAALNAMSAVLVTRVRTARAAHRRAAEELRELEFAVKTRQDADERVALLRARLEELEDALAWFDCGDDDPAELLDVESAVSLLAERPTRSESTAG